MSQPGGPESEPRPDDSVHIRLSRRELLKYAKFGLVAAGGGLAWSAFQRIFPAGENPVPPSVKVPTPQPLSPAERAVLPQRMIEEIERERGVPTPTSTETLKNWKKYEYGPRFIIGDIRMFTSAMIPEGWYGSEVPQGEGLGPTFQLTEDWFSPNGSWSEYVNSGKGWMGIGLTRNEGFSVSREDYFRGRSMSRGDKVSTISLGGMFGSIKDLYSEDEKPVLWIQGFAAFLERTDKVLVIRYGSGVDRKAQTEPILRKIAQGLKFSIMPDYVIGRGKEVSSITAKAVSGTEGWKTYHYFSRHKDPRQPIKKPLMEAAVLLPLKWQFVGCEENTGGYPCFLFGEDKSGKGFREKLAENEVFAGGSTDEFAKGLSPEKYPRKMVDGMISSEIIETKIVSYDKNGRPIYENVRKAYQAYKLIKESKMEDVIIGRYRGKAQDFELALGNDAKEKDVPLWVKIFSAPLADGTDRRFTIFFKGPLARRSELEDVWNKVIQSMELRFYHKLE